MGYISKYDTRFLTVMNRKYKKYKVNFEYYDDYILWLYYELCRKKKMKYYRTLEKDLWEYVEFQNGKERECRGKLNSGWEDE